MTATLPARFDTSRTIAGLVLPSAGRESTRQSATRFDTGISKPPWGWRSFPPCRSRTASASSWRKRLSAKLEEIDGIMPPFVPSNTSHVHWLYHFRIATGAFRVDTGEFIDALNAEGLRCGPAMYYLIPYSHTFMEDREAILESLPNAREHLSNTVRWPWTDKYSDTDIEDMAAIVAKVAGAYRN